MIHLFKINGLDVKTSMINSTCAKVKHLEIIYLLRIKIEMEVIHVGAALAEKNRLGQTSRSYSKDLMQGLIVQDSQDSDDDMDEIDIEAKLLEIELR